MIVLIHHLDDFCTRDEFGITGSEVVLTRRDLFPSFPREGRMFHRVAGSMAEEFASGVETLLFPCRVDVVEKRLAQPEIDLYRFRLVRIIRENKIFGTSASARIERLR